MGSKHKIKKEDLKAFFATSDKMMQNTYHEIYNKLGLVKSKNGNFICINEAAHSRGHDSNPSMSINNVTGQWHCFTCGIKGNLQVYWRDYIKTGDDSYTDWLIDFLDMDNGSLLRFSTTEKDPNFEKNSQQLRDLYDKIQNKHFQTNGKPWMMSGDLSKMIRDMNRLPMENLDKMVDNLLNDQAALSYLYETRKITKEVIKTYKIGQYVTDKGFKKYVFPTINAEGDYINAKTYDPTNPNPAFKWMHLYKGREFGPVPINNFTKPKIYFFEGEPDCYCAISFGYEGAVTMGPIAKKNVNDVFGENRAKQLFMGKEIVIVFDADEASKKPAQELATSLLPYAKQVKIVDLNRSKINPYGLDPSAVKKITIQKDGKEIIKTKRAEKDFTEFMKKNGFEEEAVRKFDFLVANTPVFTVNFDRTRKEVYKVTIQEANASRYYSSDRSISLDLVASVSEAKPEAFMYPTEFSISCPVMTDPAKAVNMCSKCSIKNDKAFGTEDNMIYKLVREHTKETINDSRCREVKDHDILGLIQVTESQKNQQLKKLYGIPDQCKACMFYDEKTEKLIHVMLGKDINEYEEAEESRPGAGIKGNVEIEAFIQGNLNIIQNQSYRFNGVQTTSWNGQQAVLFVDKVEPIETSIESFKMEQDIHDILTVFKVQEGETIAQHIKRRHDTFANSAGVTGREDLFLINDLAYMSPIEMKNSMLPSIKRGWVEVLIAGDPRTGKTLVSKFFHKHYKVGKIIGGSSGVSRSGLIGGTKQVGKRPQVSWGAFVMGDGGLIIIDEMSEIDTKTLTDLGDIRSEGIAKVQMIVSGSERARTRKIMLSNPRGTEEQQKEYNYGIQFLKDLCLQPRILARFDIGYVVKSEDVDVKTFESSYKGITTEFNEFQCRHLIMWAYSRKSEDVVYEDGFNDLVNDLNMKMNEQFDQSTQLVNQEQRAKLIRLSISLATMLYSTPEDDWNKILVKKDHLLFIYNFLIKIYCGPNMMMDSFSKMKKESKKLGSMDFMTNICKYIDIKPLIRESEFTEKSLQQIFYDYLNKTFRGGYTLPDAKTDEIKTTGFTVFDATPKLIGILISRNCIERCGRGMFKKTSMFTEWLTQRDKLGEDAEYSNILEPVANESNSSLIEKVTAIGEARKSAKKQTGS